MSSQATSIPPPLSPQQISDEVVRRFDQATDPRLRFLMQSLVGHLHAFAIETSLSEAEWREGIDFLTAVGQACSPLRQELILLSDTLGLSMVTDAINHPSRGPATESTVLGPFHVPGAPRRAMGESIRTGDGDGETALVSGRVLDADGRPLDGAELDVWQNSANGRYAAQDPTMDPDNLRGRFTTGPDGCFWFRTVRPTDYAIPHDGPVGAMLRATGRHPWRAAHLHIIVSAPGCVPVTTHLFDDQSAYLDSDTVFGVKPSLVCHFERHDPGEPDSPPGVDGTWYRLDRDLVLTRATTA